jgi:ribosomal protein S18 acetylase RimI-like enzyme
MSAQIQSVRPTDNARDDNSMRVRRARQQDEVPLLATLTSAFVNDPPARWLYPEPENYLRYFSAFAHAFGGGAVDRGTAWHTLDHAACALWFAPHSAPAEEPLLAVVERSIPTHRHTEVFAVMQALGEAHPAEPHWYLPLIGVDAACQGRGLGSTLLRHTLSECDRDGVPAYLEASSPRSVPLYERHGFKALAPIRVRSCPPILPMLREPQVRPR